MKISTICLTERGCYTAGAAFFRKSRATLPPGATLIMSRFTFLKLRFLIALFLAAAVIVMDANHMSVAGITSEKIFQAISADYEDAIEAWVETISTSR